jgi:hypothetical protein
MKYVVTCDSGILYGGFLYKKGQELRITQAGAERLRQAYPELTFEEVDEQDSGKSGLGRQQASDQADARFQPDIGDGVKAEVGGDGLIRRKQASRARANEDVGRVGEKVGRQPKRRKGNERGSSPRATKSR